MIFHVSTAEGAAVIRRARGEGLKVFAETCPQYLFLTAQDLDRPGLEGAQVDVQPAARARRPTRRRCGGRWRSATSRSSRPTTRPIAYRRDRQAARRPKPNFKQIANGMPGLETRLPLLFDAMVSKGRWASKKFVELTATSPAKIYGLHPRKGTIAVGADADIAIWDPDSAK